MNSNDRRKLKRYEMTVYVMLLAFSVIFALVGNSIPSGTINSIMINFASDLLSVAVLFFVINKVFLLGDDGTTNKILNEVNLVKTSIEDQLNQVQKRQQQKISVILQNGANRLELPVKLHRAEFTRAEIMGRIRMIPRKDQDSGTFKLKYSSTSDFLEQINRISASDGDEALIIPCDDSEFSQFDLNP
jgi:hypothetical protein